jgi:hypothetical protein
MNGSANTPGGKRQTQKATVLVTPATECITHQRFKPGTSLADDSQQLGGTKLTLSRNAMPAIFSEAENSGYMAAVLKAKTPEQLRSLCEKRTKEESTRYASYETYMTIIGQRPCNLQKPKTYSLSPQERIKFDELRKARLDLLNVNMVSNIKALNYGSRWQRFQQLSHELYQLTGHNGYNYGLYS